MSCRVYYFALVKNTSQPAPPQKGWINPPSPFCRAGLPRHTPLCLTLSTPLSFLVVISSPCSSTVAVGFSPLLLVPSSVVIVSYQKTCQKKGIFCSENIISQCARKTPELSLHKTNRVKTPEIITKYLLRACIDVIRQVSKTSPSSSISRLAPVLD